MEATQGPQRASSRSSHSTTSAGHPSHHSVQSVPQQHTDTILPSGDSSALSALPSNQASSSGEQGKRKYNTRSSARSSSSEKPPQGPSPPKKARKAAPLAGRRSGSSKSPGLSSRPGGSTTGSCASSQGSSQPSHRTSASSNPLQATTAHQSACSSTSSSGQQHPATSSSGQQAAHSSRQSATASGSRTAKMNHQNDPLENESQPTASGTNNNSSMDQHAAPFEPSSANSAGGTSNEDGDVNRLRELLEQRGIPPHLLGALGPRMQHFLHRYVSIGGVSNLTNGNHSRATQLLENIQSSDETEQLGAVIEMSQTLVMGNEDSLAGFPFKAAIPVLVNLMSAGGTDGRPPNFEVMHNSCRALTYMMESLPRSSSIIAESIPKFVEKLESIQCMDVAEQSLSALEILSKRHAKAILHANGVSSCLAFLDFFSMNAQRSALTIASNCCAHLGVDDWSLVSPCVPLLAARLDPEVCNASSDKKSIDCVCAALSRIVEAFQGNPEVLKEVAPRATLNYIQTLLLRSPPLVSSNTFVIVIRMLALLCQGCPTIATELLEGEIAGTLRHLLVGPERDGKKENPELLPRSPQELYEITGLVMELMPRLPEDGVFSVDQLLWRPVSMQTSGSSSASNVVSQVHWRWQDNNMDWQPYSLVDSRCIEGAHSAGEEEVSLSINGKTYSLNFTQMQQTNEESGTSRAVERTVQSTSHHKVVRTAKDARIDLVRAKPELIQKFVASLMNVLYEVYGSSAGQAVKHKCLRAMLRIVYYTNAETLEKILKADTVSSQLSQMLSTRNDLHVTVMALQLTDILMQKMPQLFIHSFNREGVIHKITELSTKTVEPLESPSAHLTEVASVMTAADSASPTLDKGDQQAALFPQLSKLPDMLKRKRTSAAPAAVNDKTKRAAAAVSSRRMKSSEGAGPKRGGPATRSRLSVHDLESPEDGVAAKPSGSGQSSAQGSSNSSPVSLRFMANSVYGGGPAMEENTGASAASGGKKSVGGASAAGFFSQLHPSRWGKWGHQQSQNSQQGLNYSSAGSSSTAPVDKGVSLVQQSVRQNRQEIRHKIKQWINDESKALKDNYFATYHKQLERTTLERLESAVTLIKSAQEDSSSLVQGLTDICGVLQQGDVSSFELIHSGMVSALLDLFSDLGSPTFNRNAKILLQVFAGVSPLIDPGEATNVPLTVPDSTALLTLVSRLNSCVSQLEQFALKVHDVPGGIAGTRGTSALKFFNTHQLKCNLERHPSCSNLKQWKNGPVKIDPLALVQAIEKYLVVRGYGKLRDDDECGSEEDNSDEDLDDTFMATNQPSHNRHRLQFLIGETPLSYNMTVYQAIRQFSHLSDPSGHSESDVFDAAMGESSSSAIWTQTHTIHYRPASCDETSQNGLGQRKKNKNNAAKKPAAKDDLWNEGSTPTPACPIEESLSAGRNHEAKLVDPSQQMLTLLRLLYTINSNWGLLYGVYNFLPALTEDTFLNPKLSNKSLRQLQDPLALMTGNIPPWIRTLAAYCPFVMPFETRHNLFYSTCFDRDRALQRLMDSSPDLSSGDSSERVTPRLDRKKRTVNRDDLLKQAEIVFNEISPSNSRAMLEIQYDNEVGSGLGPTLEFYALVSRELQRCDLDMWRNSMTGTDRALYQKGGEKKFVFCPGGLYPCPVARNVKASQLNKLKSRFKMCGKFVAKALMDSRMLDMHFSVPMFKWMLGEEKTLCLRDIQHIDEDLFRNLCKLQNLVEQKNKIIALNRNLSGPALAKSLEKLTLDGCSVELLGLDFTLPGYDIELKKAGSNLAVTIHNLDQYVKLMVHWTLVEGVKRQMEAFKEGFECIFSMENLGSYFRGHEMNRALCGDSALWTTETLKGACKIDHGYTADSDAIRYLFEIMVEFDESQRRQFLLFVTGSPRLPVGGFRALVPPLTIVKKTSDGDYADVSLPSVMTCVNYLKLPDYPTKEVMREKLLVAQSEGQCSFHLS